MFCRRIDVCIFTTESQRVLCESTAQPSYAHLSLPRCGVYLSVTQINSIMRGKPSMSLAKPSPPLAPRCGVYLSVTQINNIMRGEPSVSLAKPCPPLAPRCGVYLSVTQINNIMRGEPSVSPAKLRILLPIASPSYGTKYKLERSSYATLVHFFQVRI
jgi:hypothetical protein